MDVYFINYIDDTLKIDINGEECTINLTDGSFNDEGYIQFWFRDDFELRFFPSEENLYTKLANTLFWSRAKNIIYQIGGKGVLHALCIA